MHTVIERLLYPEILFGLSVSLEGYAFAPTGFLNNFKVSKSVKKTMSVIERLCFMAAGLCCIESHSFTDIVGLIIICVLIVAQLIRRRKSA